MPNLWPRSQFIRQVATMSFSAVVAQVVALVFGPINSRLFDPADFGLIAPFSALFSILPIVATMRYEMAIPVAEDDNEGFHILVLCGVLSLLWCCVIAIVTLAFGNRIAHMLSPDPRLPHYLWYLPIGLFGVTTYALLVACVVRKQAFRELSLSRIAYGATGSGSSALLGFVQMGVSGLFTGSLLGISSGIACLIPVSIRGTRGARGHFSVVAILAAARRYRKFPQYNISSALFSNVSLQLPVFMLSAGFGARETGWYGYCSRVLMLPTDLISAAIVPVFLSRAKQAVVDGSIPKLTSRMLDAIVGIDAFFLAVIALFGPELFAFAFGEPWRHAGLYASVLTPSLLLNFIVAPLGALPLVLERQGTDLMWQLLLLLVRGGALGIGVYLKDDVLAMAGFGVGSALVMAAHLIWLLHIAHVTSTPVILRLIRELVVACALAGVCRVLYTWSQGNLLVTGLSLGASAAWWTKRTLHRYREFAPHADR